MSSMFAAISYIETVTGNISQIGTATFRIEYERRGYNPLTSKYLILEVTCAYDAGSSRHSGVAKAIETKAVISVCGELYKGNNMMQILTSDIEWNYSYSGNLNNKQEQTTGNKKRRNQDLLNFEDKYQNKRSDKTKRETINLDENKKSDQLENHIEDVGNNKTNDVNSEQNESQDTSKKSANSKADKLKSALRNSKSK
ncbi:10756_t:CDS:2 [Gigaspora margarita]|uniref:10756_t:CDS:1 n=1 Tax=Gigaspora margarita TaxID=4874 RepID=A0ABN7USU3_GIGMA|nr:10756_t:CDS:2 [Gigaspora margarita]